MVVILNNSSFQFSKVHAQFQGCWHKKSWNPYAWLLLTVMEKKIIYNFGNDFYFQNEELSL